MPSSTPPLDLLSPRFIEDPVPMIDRMYAESPIFFDERLQGWMIGGMHDTRTLAKEPRLSAQRKGYVTALVPPEYKERAVPLADWYGEWMVMRDGADHRRLRQLAAHAFTPRNIERLRGRMLEVIEPILDAALARGELEVLGELAFPLPRTVICEMVGIPAADVALITEWGPTINNILGATLTSPEIIERVHTARARIHEYFTQLIAERRRAPREGEILTSLVQAIEGEDSLTEDEIVDLVVFIMVGAYDTTAYLISNGLYLLLQHPEQLAAVQADPRKIDGWIEETLRLEPSITINTRTVIESFEYKGHRLEAGQMAYFLPQVANRDPEYFPDPNRFDIDRPNAGDHTSFGFGAHFCIGAPLARMEARLAFQRLIARTQRLALPEQEFVRAPSMVIRALQALRIELS